MKIVIYGGNGFVGHWLIKKLQEMNYQILSCDLQKDSVMAGVDYQQVDIRDLEQVRRVRLEQDDIVVNLAANQYHTKVPRKNREAYFFDTNTTGAGYIIKAAFEQNCRRIVQFTTDMTYGKPQYLPVDTKHPQNPFGPYGKSKKAVEDICRAYREKGMKITIFRPRMINGPGRLGILKKLFWLIERNLPVPTIGNGKNCYQMISVFDCVSAIICAIERDVPNDEYNLGSQNPPTTRELLCGLIKEVGSKSIVVPTPGKLVKLALACMGFFGFELMYKEQYMIADENYILDISKTQEDLGWQPQYADGDMIIDAYKNWKLHD